MPNPTNAIGLRPRITRFVSLGVLLIVGAGLISACDDGNDVKVAIENARIELAKLSGDASARAEGIAPATKVYQTVLGLVEPYANDRDSGTANQRATAQLLVAQAQIGLSQDPISEAMSLERDTMNTITLARGVFSDWIELTATANAVDQYDPTKDLSSLRAELADRERDLQKVEQSKSETDLRIAALRDEADKRLTDARQLRTRVGMLTLKAAQSSAAGAAELAKESRVLSRSADALELDAASISAESQKLEPASREFALEVGMFEGQISAIREAMRDTEALAEQGRADAQAARAAAQSSADSLHSMIRQVHDLRDGSIDDATSRAENHIRRAIQNASSARSSLRDQAIPILGRAHMQQATLYQARVDGLDSLVTILSAASAQRELPNAETYASDLVSVLDSYNDAKQTLDDALSQGASALESAQIRQPKPEMLYDEFDNGALDNPDNDGVDDDYDDVNDDFQNDDLPD